MKKILSIILLCVFSFNAYSSGITKASNYNPSSVAITGGTVQGTDIYDQVTFNATMSAMQTITSNTWTKVGLNQETIDTNSNFDTTANRFMPTKRGYYLINYSLSHSCLGNPITYVASSIYKNGAAYASVNSYINDTNGFITAKSQIVYFNGSTDYAELWGVVTCVAGTSRFGQSATDTNFSGILIRSAP